jgi:hypothetical protein
MAQGKNRSLPTYLPGNKYIQTKKPNDADVYRLMQRCQLGGHQRTANLNNGRSLSDPTKKYIKSFF